ncbi:hypothetical protein NEUTE1DRAFT_118412 [Neurospora tetrasperma FGSC 2508]|uniref:Uncharacterized protein n=1 Tax=Neurospora tetrasperma (strain FGSC 2508 / ATCC MYA-4615 / P0657) TaxID=510951 RepID=F8MYS2_NEUT8|nr:uncharacterized protein NEUTE1DRAFT_118412 [Neurospora tetrasperma FGSC 2508]EGO51469.1 hypothetical protein NEUTE1DRAFT_118412 [Neurospora tetrasperma FGSC 2508]EGZ78549.1 hypothetical protein NEUTE2DRAFT_143250 [Neurospora tetrasperma FGSC 2509]
MGRGSRICCQKAPRDLLMSSEATMALQAQRRNGYNVSEDDDAASLDEWFDAVHICWSRGYKEDGVVGVANFLCYWLVSRNRSRIPEL